MGSDQVAQGFTQFEPVLFQLVMDTLSLILPSCTTGREFDSIFLTASQHLLRAAAQFPYVPPILQGDQAQLPQAVLHRTSILSPTQCDGPPH